MYNYLQKTNLPYVEYTSSIEPDDTFLNRKDDQKQGSNTSLNSTSRVNDKAASDTPLVPQQQSRAVAKKSTTKKQVLPEPTYNAGSETKPSHSIVVSPDIVSTRTFFISITIINGKVFLKVVIRGEK